MRSDNNKLSVHAFVSVVAWLAAFSVSGIAAEPSGTGATIKVALKLAPPTGLSGIKCSVSTSMQSINDRWRDWDGKSNPGVSDEELRLDAKRMASVDAVRYFESAALIFKYLAKSKDAKIALKSGIDMARLYVDANKLTTENADEILKYVRNGVASRNATSLLVLGEIYERGLGVTADFNKAVDYYKAASQQGQADSLLRLAQFTLEGKIKDFALDPSVVVKLAFKGMIENEARDPCHGIKRIAGIYAKGTGLMPQDHELAVQWYRLAADAGDMDSAWTVTKYHLVGENVKADTTVLKTYLKMAAEGGNVLAMLEMGKAYEDGSLFESNVDTAVEWYSKAARQGSVLAEQKVIRLGNLADGERLARLKVIADSKTAPTTGLIDYARAIVEIEGRQNGGRKAEPYLRRALRAGSKDALIALYATERLETSDGLVSSDVTNRLETAANIGDVVAAGMLADHFKCFAPQAPEMARATNFETMVEDNESNLGAMIKIAMETPETGDSNDAAERLALYRTAATRGLSDGLALLIDALERQGDARDERIFAYWNSKLAEDAQAQWRLARVKYARRQKGDDVAYIADLKKAHAAGSSMAAIDLAKMTIKATPDHAHVQREFVFDLLLKPIEEGRGEALGIAKSLMKKGDVLPDFMQPEVLDRQTRARGDSRFALEAAALETNPETKAALIELGTRVSSCSFTDQARLAEVFAGNNKLRATQYILIAEALAAQTASDQLRLGSVFEQIDPAGFGGKALRAFQVSASMGNQAAAAKVAKAALGSGYGPEALAALRKQMPEILASNDSKRIYTIAKAFHQANSGTVDPGSEMSALLEKLYAKASDLGHPAAMREYAISLQSGTFTVKNPQRAVFLLDMAGELGDRTSLRHLGYAYLTGFGANQSMERAVMAFSKAAKLGDQAAIKILPTLSPSLSRN